MTESTTPEEGFLARPVAQDDEDTEGHFRGDLADGGPGGANDFARSAATGDEAEGFRAYAVPGADGEDDTEGHIKMRG